MNTPTPPATATAEPKNSETALRQCLNCKTDLQGDFCHQCGQEDTHYVRGVGSLLNEFFGEMGNWDGRVWRTLIPLFFRPAFLSNAYVQGRRVPYVPPLRLYLFVSIIAFVVFSQFGNNLSFGATDLTSAEEQELYQALGETPRENDLTRLKSGEQQFTLGFLSEAENLELTNKFRFLMEHPKILINRFFSVAPQMMLIMLPIFAFVLKLMYLFSKRYYIEHVVLALHTHAFLLISLMFMLIVSKFSSPDAPAMLKTPITLVFNLLWIWIFVYLFLTQKRFYRQSWLVTFLKFNITGLVYLVLLSLGALGTLIWSIYSA
ncbi:MAG: DUF3667 domain-containing protein [Idiomarina sp.]|nr:DUF3667 domain-containing protein [Idiomarina sp.]